MGESDVNLMSENDLAMFTTNGTLKSMVAAIALGGVLSTAPAAVAWAGMFDGPLFLAQNGGHGDRRGNHAREARQPREVRNVQPAPQPQAPRERSRGQMSDEERRQLHRDLDKANRELYGGHRR